MTPADVAKTLKAKGQSMTLIRSAAGVYDPVTGGITGGATLTLPVSGITTSYRDGVINQAGSLIQSGDKKALIDAIAVTPVPGDTLIIAGVAWQVIAVDAVDPAGVAYLFKCQVRK